MKRRLLRFMHPPREPDVDDDPLSGVANLFDVSLAFIVALLIALFSTFGLQHMFDAEGQWTMTSTDAEGRVRIVSKEGRQIKVQEVTDRELSGDGDRLGVAYRLPDGRVIYVPEGSPDP